MFNLLLRFIVATAAAVVPAVPNSQLERAKADLLCYINRDTKACEANTSLEGTAEADQDYLTFRCAELAQANSCVRLGDYLKAKNRGTDASGFFTKACEAKELTGCLRLLEERLAKAKEGMPPDQFKAIITEAQTYYATFCTDATRNLVDCTTAQKEINFTAAGNSRRSCQLAQWYFYPQNLPPKMVVTEQTRTVQDDCLRSCDVASGRLGALEKGQSRLRTQCLFDGKPVGAEIWRDLVNNMGCDTTMQRLGAEDLSYYQPCACEIPHYERVQDLGKPFGLVASGYVSNKFETFAGKKWFKCAMRLDYLDESYGRSPNCRAGLQSAQLKLKDLKAVKDVAISFAAVQCKGP